MLYKLCRVSKEEDIKASDPATFSWEDPQSRSLTIVCTQHLLLPFAKLVPYLLAHCTGFSFLISLLLLGPTGSTGTLCSWATMQCPSPTRWLGSEAQYRQQGMKLCSQAFCQSPLCS